MVSLLLSTSKGEAVYAVELKTEMKLELKTELEMARLAMEFGVPLPRFPGRAYRRQSTAVLF